jgi:hypothetical protein
MFSTLGARNPGLTTICALFTLLLAPAALHASPITYDVILTPGAGSLYGGTGSFTIEGAPTLNGISNYTVAAGTLDALSFDIDDQIFSLAGSTGNALVQFQNGVLSDITFLEQIGATPARFSLMSSGNYDFSYDNLQASSYGTFTAQPASVSTVASTVPEPTSIVFFATGFLICAGAMFLRRSASLAS